jgi:hypothetical protein
VEGSYEWIKRIRVEKKGIRALGIAESFVKEISRKSTLAGVVMRSDLVVDGIVLGSAALEGDDATQAILDMYYSLRRNDINVIMLGGAVISLYNIVDVDLIAEKTNLPVICITFEPSRGLAGTIKKHFPDRWEEKIRAYKRLGKREKVTLHTGYDVYVRVSRIGLKIAKQVLDKFTLQGSLPEPIKVAKIVARAAFYYKYSK